MEHHAQSVDDAFIGGLSYKLKAGASYVTNRRSVSYFAQGGNTYSRLVVKVIRFNLTGDQWMDPSTCRVAFQLNNNSPYGSASLSLGLNQDDDSAGSVQVPTPVTPLHWNPAVFFRRARITASGQAIEDIDYFNIFSLMLTSLMPEDEQNIISIEGFGNYDIRYPQTGTTNDHRASYRYEDFDYAGQVYHSRRVMLEPPDGQS